MAKILWLLFICLLINAYLSSYAFAHNKVVVIPMDGDIAVIAGYPDCYPLTTRLNEKATVCLFNQDAPQARYSVPINKTYQCEIGKFEYFDIGIDFLYDNRRHIRSAIIRKGLAQLPQANVIKLALELSIFNRKITISAHSPYLISASIGSGALSNSDEMCKDFTGPKTLRFTSSGFEPSPGNQLSGIVELKLFFTPQTISVKSIEIYPN